jgi:PhnB protein
MHPTAQRPERYRDAVIAHIMLDDAAAAIDFYTRALDAAEVFRIAGPDGRILHAEIAIEGSLVMLGDADEPFASPATLGATTMGLHVYVEDVDTRFAKAVEAGASVLQQPQDMFYGARTAMLQDPFGHIWVLLTHQQDLSVEETTQRGEALLAGSVDA